MNITTSLKILPVVTALALGVSIAPATALADKDRDHQREYAGQHYKYKKSHKGERRHDEHRGHKKYRRHGDHDRHARHQHHGHGHRHGHRNHRELVTVYDYRPHHGRRYYDAFDNLRFMIGLHTGNFDLVIRD